MKHLIAVVSIAATITACGKSESPPPPVVGMPEANAENCKPEKVAKLQDKDMQQAFSSLCLRQGRAQQSPERKW